MITENELDSDDGKALFEEFLVHAAATEISPTAFLNIACNMLALAVAYTEADLETMLEHVREINAKYEASINITTVQ